MSSMIQQPARRIQIGGGGPPGAGGPGGGPGGAGGASDGPDSAQVRQLIQTAIDSLRQAEDLEGDAADQALIAKTVADLRGFIGNQQKMEDTAMGAGPGIKLVRKNSPPPGRSGGGAGGY